MGFQDINKISTDINRRKIQIETGEKTIKKLTKAIEELKKEKERLVSEKEAMMSVFKEIEVKAFTVQENYKKTQEVYIFLYCFWSQILLIICFQASLYYSFAAYGSTQSCA